MTQTTVKTLPPWLRSAGVITVNALKFYMTREWGVTAVISLRWSYALQGIASLQPFVPPFQRTPVPVAKEYPLQSVIKAGLKLWTIWAAFSLMWLKLLARFPLVIRDARSRLLRSDWSRRLQTKIFVSVWSRGLVSATQPWPSCLSLGF